MNADSTQSVLSDVPYAVVEVGGEMVGTGLAQFLGETDFVVEHGAHHHRIWGLGAHGVTGIRFYEKDPDRHGKDVRIWQVDQGTDGRFTASHTAAI